MSTFAVADEQFTEDKMDKPYKIASVRIHVERCIQKLKLYNILVKKVTLEVCPTSTKFRTCVRCRHTFKILS